MRPQDIKIGAYYRLWESPNYSYAKALEVIKGKTGVNTNSYAVVKCEHTISKDDSFGFIRYFKPANLIKESSNEK